MAILDSITKPFKGATSKTKKKKASAAASGTVRMDILDKLAQEHDEVQELLQKLVDSEKAAERTKLLKDIKQALVPHNKAEEKVVYERVLAVKSKDAKIDAHEGYVEHSVGDKVLTDLGKIKNRMSPEFTATAKVLKELVDHHVEEEEDSIWSDVKDNFSMEQRIAMHAEFEAAKKRVKVKA